jgi:transposase
MARRLHALSPLGSARGVAPALGAAAERTLCPSAPSFDRLHHHPRSPARCWRAKKNGSDQALGRSRGGLSTKIHAATIDENCSVALHLTPGHAHDGRQFEALYESLSPENVLESAAMDKGYDADRIRARLHYDGVEAVIPPIPSRAQKPSYDPVQYRERNRIERFFNKLKQFRRIATRYDKLQHTFFAALYLIAAFILIKNS